MGDEYTSRYAGMSHRELYDGLMAGSPTQIDGLTASWGSIEGDARRLAAELDGDLGRLVWDGDAGQEFQRRLSLVSSYSTQLADDHNAVKTGLAEMRRALAEAQKQAEDPADTDDNDSTLAGVALGAPLGPAGMVIGGLWGHNRDEEQREQAQQRMVQVVAGLAADYDLNGHTNLLPPTEPPVELPGGNPTSSVDPTSGNPVHAPSGGPTSGPGGSAPTLDAAAPGTLSTGPTAGAGGNAPTGVGTSLLGAEAGVIGAGALAAGSALAGQVAALPSAVGTGGLPGAGLGGSALPAGGVLGAGQGGAGAGQGGAGAGRAAASSPGGGASGGRPNAVSAASGGRPNAAGRGGPGPHGAASGSPLGDEEQDEYDTWLTEDQMVWGNDDSAPPAVLGEPAPTPGGSASPTTTT